MISAYIIYCQLPCFFCIFRQLIYRKSWRNFALNILNHVCSPYDDQLTNKTLIRNNARPSTPRHNFQLRHKYRRKFQIIDCWRSQEAGETCIRIRRLFRAECGPPTVFLCPSPRSSPYATVSLFSSFVNKFMGHNFCLCVSNLTEAIFCKMDGKMMIAVPGNWQN